VFRGSTAGGTHEAGRVRVVDHDERVVAIRQVADGPQIRDRSVHREHAVSRDEPGPGRLCLFETLFELGHVVVGVAMSLRLAQPDAVDDAGVIEGVRDHGILLVQQRLKQTAVGIETGGVEDRILGSQEPAQPLLELFMHILRAADEPNRRHAITEAIYRTVCRLSHAA